MNKEELSKIIELHGRWLRNEGGERANLRSADLRYADLRSAAGNRAEIKSIFASEAYPITYTRGYLQIGCERHEIKEWAEFDDKRILEMDGKILFLISLKCLPQKAQRDRKVRRSHEPSTFSPGSSSI